MNNEVLIKVEGVSKKFCKDLKTSLKYGVYDLTNEVLGRTHGDKLRNKEFWAVKDISFELKRGEVLGLIGKNGAGKTTLLKMLNGLIKPDGGRIEIRGRIGALIALGAGFNPILTGRENVYVNGSVLGLTKKEIDEKFDEIVDFAEIGDFIDSPVQSYSSGMNVRLGFAIASSLDPDILLIDEVLAVGDVGFRTKCYNRIYELVKRAAVIFVSHNMPQIDRLCSQAIVMKRGEEVFLGNTGEAIDVYNKFFINPEGKTQISANTKINYIKINNESDQYEFQMNGPDPLTIHINAEIPAAVKLIEVKGSFLDPSFDLISTFSNNLIKVEVLNSKKGINLEIDIPSLNLGSGVKLLSLSIQDFETNEILYWAYGKWVFYIKNNLFIKSPSIIPSKFSVK